MPGVAGALVLLVGALTAGYTVDDAYIVGRFARNLAAGAGYGLNPGDLQDGVTGPLWVLPGWLASLGGLDPVVAAKLLGLGCAAVSALLVVQRLGQRSGGRLAGASALAVLGLSPSLGTWGVAGLETGLATLLVTLAALAATRRPRPAPLAVGSAIGLLAWTRPELAPFAAAPLLILWRRDARAAVPATALAVAGAAAVVAFRLTLFGHALPLSFDAKAGDLGHGVRYAATALVLATSGVGAWLALRGARGGRVDDLLLGLGLGAHLLAMALAGGDWMPGYRLLVPVLPVYALLVGVGVARLALRHRRRALLPLVLACAVPALDLATRLPQLPATAASQRAAVERIAPWLAENARRVALVDVGLLPYASGVEVVDLGGITDAEIARLPGGHLDKRIPPELLRRRAPDTLLLHSAGEPAVDDAGRLRGLAGFAVERRVAAMPWVREGFRVVKIFEYRPGYLYVALRARSQEAVGEDEQGDAQ